jgi:outer membrane protein OmpA-like peptidoglycan-associated protein
MEIVRSTKAAGVMQSITMLVSAGGLALLAACGGAQRLQSTQAEANRSWWLYFNEDAQLDAEAQATIRSAADAIRARHLSTVVVQGYADPAQDPTVEGAIAARRVDEIRRALLANGIRADAATDLRMTPPGTRYPLERHPGAEIIARGPTAG